MKPSYLLVLAITATIFISTFFISQGLPTGFLIKSGTDLGLKISIADVSDTTARISWKTQTEALSMLVINNEQNAFGASTQFSKELTGLKPGTSYNYVIRACNERKCEEKSSELTTKGAGKAKPEAAGPITGAITGIDLTRTMQKSISFIFYALIGMVVLVIAGKVGYEKLASSRDPMQGMVNEAKKMIENEQYEQAYEIYSKARQAYSQLEGEARLKHYDSLVSIYQNLKRYSEIKQAQRLAEKYAQGTITKDELRRLNDMLAS